MPTRLGSTGGDPVFYNPGIRKRVTTSAQGALGGIWGGTLGPADIPVPRRRGLTKEGKINRARRLQAEKNKLMKQGHYPGPYMYTPDSLNDLGAQNPNQAFLDEASPNVKLPYDPSIKGVSDTPGAGTLVLPREALRGLGPLDVGNWGASTVRGGFPDIDKAWLANSAAREAEKREKFEDAVEDEMLYGPPAGPAPSLGTREPLHMPGAPPGMSDQIMDVLGVPQQLRSAIESGSQYPETTDIGRLSPSTGDPTSYPALDRVFGVEQVRRWAGSRGGVFDRHDPYDQHRLPSDFQRREERERQRFEKQWEEDNRTRPRKTSRAPAPSMPGVSGALARYGSEALGKASGYWDDIVNQTGDSLYEALPGVFESEYTDMLSPQASYRGQEELARDIHGAIPQALSHGRWDTQIPRWWNDKIGTARDYWAKLLSGS